MGHLEAGGGLAIIVLIAKLVEWVVGSDDTEDGWAWKERADRLHTKDFMRLSDSWREYE